MQKYLILDYETFSACDIKESGAYEYARHPSTEIMCVGYALGTRKELKTTKAVVLSEDDLAFRDSSEFFNALADPNTILVAHNALFEQVITAFTLKKIASDLKDIPIERWICTAALARAKGLPGSLDGATKALGLGHQKDTEGRRLMLKLCKPRKPSERDPSTRHDKPDDLQRLYEYCLKDVEAERELFLALPELTQKEREFWLLNQRMNLRGFKVDRRLINGALKCINYTTNKLDKRFQKLTGLNSAKQRGATLDLLAKHGLEITDLQAATVDETLKSSSISPFAQEILKIRQAISKSSTAKYSAFEARSKSDGRARDNTIFYGAHTGRASGTGLQPQNLFKSTLHHSDVLAGIELMRSGATRDIHTLFDSPMQLYASALRSCIVAPKGYRLEVGDFATIEVRVLFWLAGHQKGLEAIASGRDLYLEMAAKIYNQDLTKLTTEYKAGDAIAKQRRQLGKATVLGAGFGMGKGGEKFQISAKKYGIDISLTLAKEAIAAYRRLHAPVVQFWIEIENTAILALQNPGKVCKQGKLLWKKDGKWLTCRLPINRVLSYFNPIIGRGKFGGPSLSYMGVDPVSKKFRRTDTFGGKLTENAVQAIARDILQEALLRLENAGFNPVLDVHDEIVCETKNLGSTKPFEKLMKEVPEWAKGLPIDVESWAEKRYRK